MKNHSVDPLAARDIQQQVAKILRGLGNPEPPLDLREVRELLKLDRQFYSSTNTGPLQEFVSRLKVGAKELIRRPTRLFDVVLQGDLRALLLPDKKRILINDDIPDSKKRWAEGHEIAHSFTPWHGSFLFGDDQETLRISCHEKLEAEANLGSGQLLFLQGRFLEQAVDLPCSLASVRQLSSTFGNTLTTTLWRLVEEAHHDEPIFGVVSVHPQRLGEGFDPTAPCRYFIESPAFRDRFGAVTEVAAFQAIRSYTSSARGGPLGEGESVFVHRNGERHSFRMETFYNGYEALTLGIHLGPAKSQIVVA